MPTHILFGLRSDLSKTFWNALTIVTPFLSFKGTTQGYLLKISIIHSKNLNPLLNLLINYISATLAGQIFSLNPEYTVLFVNFLIIVLCNSLANCWLCLISLLTPPLEVFYQEFVNHRSKPSLISVIFRRFSNIKCFIS